MQFCAVTSDQTALMLSDKRPSLKISHKPSYFFQDEGPCISQNRLTRNSNYSICFATGHQAPIERGRPGVKNAPTVEM